MALAVGVSHGPGGRALAPACIATAGPGGSGEIGWAGVNTPAPDFRRASGRAPVKRLRLSSGAHWAWRPSVPRLISGAHRAWRPRIPRLMSGAHWAWRPGIPRLTTGADWAWRPHPCAGFQARIGPGARQAPAFEFRRALGLAPKRPAFDFRRAPGLAPKHPAFGVRRALGLAHRHPASDYRRGLGLAPTHLRRIPGAHRA